MKPLDPRLLRYASAARGFLVTAVALGLIQILLTLAFAWLLAAVLTTAIGAVTGPPISDFPVPGDVPVTVMLTAAAVVVGLRALTAWGMEVTAARAAVAVKSQLRQRTVHALTTTVAAGRGDAISDQRHGAQAVTVLGNGLDALDAYFARYLPQLVLCAVAIPIHLAVLAIYDLTTAVIVAITMPLIPVFMVLIGWTTQTAQRRQRQRLSRLARAYLDLVEGLSTLKVFNRQHHQRQNLAQISEAHRRSTMKVLRVSFLSGFVLELAASLSVALVAVSIGVRLIDGSLGLFVGLFALLIVPEAYAPLRQVGANYHAAADGVAAAEDVFEILDAAETTASRQEHDDATTLTRCPAGAVTALQVRGLSVHRGGRTVLEPVTAELPAGAITAITGPSGAGKSTLLSALLGLVEHAGTAELSCGDTHCADTRHGERHRWPLRRDDIAYAGQRHGLRAGTVLENITLGDENPDADLARTLLAELGLGSLPLESELGVHGEGLSGGQSQRLSLARALYRARRRDCPVLLCDEPSAALDTGTEAEVLTALEAEARSGRIVAVITHRPGLITAAEHRLPLGEETGHVLAG
ncbi:thiol reductant ABC exporter subunit CydD [Nesterenkonia alba]|uniref:thiol reductant ABC exporter subunit CydD n=1 Tax=Nesterenkonia alba TaxID=515814 RepID=UPI00040E6AED|nr:thiol reductant ABC exporter subunit CydD [Nesterenkonia alba]